MMTNIFLSVMETSISVSLVVAALTVAASLLNNRYAVKWKYFIWIFLALWLLFPAGGAQVRAILEKAAAVTAFWEERRPTEYGALPLEEPSRGIVLEIPAGMTEPIVFSDRGASGVTPLSVMVFVWLGGCLCIAGIYFYGYIRYRVRLKRAGSLVEDARILEQRDRLLEEMELRRSVPVAEYGEAASPMIIGFVKPVLVLPGRQYGGEELYFILKHEMVHLKRHDVYFKLLLVAANTVHWFNPVIWLMRREASVDMELSCDERVVQGAGPAEKKAYTETLFSTLHKGSARRAVLSTQFYEGKEIMKKRFQNILSRRRKRNGFLLLVCAIVLTAALGALVGCAAGREGDSGRPASGTGGSGSSGEEGDSGRPASGTGGNGSSGEEGDSGRPASGTGGSGSSGEEGDSAQASWEEGWTAVGAEGRIKDGIDVPDAVLLEAVKWAGETLEDRKTGPGNYTGWRIESLSYSYTYEDFEGMTLQVYQLNCEFRAEAGEDVVLAGGMDIVGDGWITDDYPNSKYLIFRQEGDRLSFLLRMFENDCWPGDMTFTDDLEWRLEDLKESAGDGQWEVLPLSMEGENTAGSNLWNLEQLQGGKDVLALDFSTGLRLLLPRGWQDRFTLSVEPEEDNDGERLVVSTKDGTLSGVHSTLFALRCIDSEGYSAERRYTILARETDRIIGVYAREGKEYALLFEVPHDYQITGNPQAIEELNKIAENYRDVFQSVQEVQVVTDQMQGFTECGLEDLDWLGVW